MKVFLLNPPPVRIRKKTDAPDDQHLGLGYLVSAVEQSGYPVKAVDAKLDRLTIKDTMGVIAAFAPDVLGITAMTQDMNIAAMMAKAYKDISPGVKIVLGGVHVTALPKETLEQYPVIDAGVAGEGEIAFIEILKNIEKNKTDMAGIPGAVYRSGEEIMSAPYERISDIDALPYPGWKHFGNARSYSILSARGCPFSCKFCMQAMGRTVRKRSVGSVVEELERVVIERCPDSFTFYDETFTIDKERAHKLCDELIRKGIGRKMKWTVTTRVDTVNEDILRKMYEAGCRRVDFGVESGSQEVLDRVNKKITKEQVRQAVALAKRVGFRTECAFILGHPYENMKTGVETVLFSAELNPDRTQIGIMVPYPGTEIRKMALAGEGGYKVLSNDWSEYSTYLGNALELDELSRSDLERLQLIGFLRLFVYNRRYLDLASFFFKYKREMFWYLVNLFRKREKTKKTRISVAETLRLVFTRKPG
ncbi:MAG: radical SAM protein [Candidatus Omnitrophica bacterium]|nr:radical SAM protein [Candidatus Omnitrophota bacterium]